MFIALKYTFWVDKKTLSFHDNIILKYATFDLYKPLTFFKRFLYTRTLSYQVDKTPNLSRKNRNILIFSFLNVSCLEDNFWHHYNMFRSKRHLYMGHGEAWVGGVLRMGGGTITLKCLYCNRNVFHFNCISFTLPMKILLS